MEPVEAPRSYAVEVIADSSGKWAGNALRFATPAEGIEYARDLAGRWVLVREWRVVPSMDPVSDRFEHGRVVRMYADLMGGGQ